MLHLCYTIPVKSTTSSFRISLKLRAQLEEASQRLKRGKNAIITQALEEYLQKISKKRLLEEARRQSILASSSAAPEEDAWLDHADTRGWR